jgi:hypothetical protein
MVSEPERRAHPADLDDLDEDDAPREAPAGWLPVSTRDLGAGDIDRALVRGEHLANEGIHHGTTVFVSRHRAVRFGDIVLAFVPAAGGVPSHTEVGILDPFEGGIVTGDDGEDLCHCEEPPTILGVVWGFRTLSR